MRFSPLMALLLAIGVWQLALKQTWENYQQYAVLEESATQSGNWSISPAYTGSRRQLVAKRYAAFEVDSLRWKNQLWNQVAVLAAKNELKVKSFPVWTHAVVGELSILRQEVELGGAYGGLLRMQAELDTLPGIGRITALNYRKSPRDQEVTMSLILTGIPKENKR